MQSSNAEIALRNLYSLPLAGLDPHALLFLSRHDLPGTVPLCPKQQKVRLVLLNSPSYHHFRLAAQVLSHPRPPLRWRSEPLLAEGFVRDLHRISAMLTLLLAFRP